MIELLTALAPPEDQAVEWYVSGLRKDLKSWVDSFMPSTLADAERLARKRQQVLSEEGPSQLAAIASGPSPHTTIKKDNDTVQSLLHTIIGMMDGSRKPSDNSSSPSNRRHTGAGRETIPLFVITVEEEGTRQKIAGRKSTAPSATCGATHKTNAAPINHRAGIATNAAMQMTTAGISLRETEEARCPFMQRARLQR